MEACARVSIGISAWRPRCKVSFIPHCLACPVPLPFTDKALAAGEQVLHTYGDLSDAQLVQTYGFVDLEASAAAAGQAAARANKKQKGGARAPLAAPKDTNTPAGVPHLTNPHNYVQVDSNLR